MGLSRFLKRYPHGHLSSFGTEISRAYLKEVHGAVSVFAGKFDRLSDYVVKAACGSFTSMRAVGVTVELASSTSTSSLATGAVLACLEVTSS